MGEKEKNNECLCVRGKCQDIANKCFLCVAKITKTIGVKNDQTTIKHLQIKISSKIISRVLKITPLRVNQ